MSRRATPSSSINANAAASCSRVAMRTDRPESSRRRPPRLVPRNRTPRETLAAAPHRKRPEQSDALTSSSRIDIMCLGGIFIEPDEVTQGHRIGNLVGFSERIESQGLFESGNEDRNRQ